MKTAIFWGISIFADFRWGSAGFSIHFIFHTVTLDTIYLVILMVLESMLHIFTVCLEGELEVQLCSIGTRIWRVIGLKKIYQPLGEIVYYNLKTIISSVK